MASVAVETPGKVNLVLDVHARRGDGYHDISSLMMAVGLYDRLVVEEAGDGQIEVVCNAPGVPSDETNLVHRAAKRLREHAGIGLGCRVHLHKGIPIGGGMGGGSSDAAAVMAALNRLWQLGLADRELADIGATIGSDIPFFLATPSAIVTGTGNCVQPVGLAWSGWVVLVMCGVHVSTRDVYARCRPADWESRRGEIVDLLGLDSATAMRARMRNELECAVYAVAPKVRRVRESLVELGVATARVSGAGSVLFDLFDEECEALELADRVRANLSAVSVSVVEAPVRMEFSQGENSHGNQRCSGEVDRQR